MYKMLKLKPLKPAFREKKRYIVYEIKTEETINMFQMQQSLVKKLNSMLGVFDSATAGILPLKFDNKTQRGILRVNYSTVERVRACFALIKEIDNIKLQITTKGVSGIIKIAKEKYFEHNKKTEKKNVQTKKNK